MVRFGLIRSPSETPVAGRGCGHPAPRMSAGPRAVTAWSGRAVVRTPGGVRLACRLHVARRLQRACRSSSSPTTAAPRSPPRSRRSSRSSARATSWSSSTTTRATTRSRSSASWRPAPTCSRRGRNAGFAAAANAGAAAATGDLLVFLNPDARPAPGFVEAIAAPLRDGRGWAAWMGLVTAEDGRVVNTNGGVVHFTGIAWAGEAGAPAPGIAGRRARGGVPVRCLPRRPARGVGARRRLRRELLHVPRGRRPLAPHPPRGRPPRGRAVRRRRSRLRRSPRARTSGGCSSATAGRRSCAAIPAGC